MPGQQPDIIRLFRILHIDNVEYLLHHGLFNQQHPQADPNYINIGDHTLITQRHDYVVPIDPPNGTLGEYVPFYFGTLSPMLLNIKTGHRGIRQQQQSDIIYICCRLNTIIAQCSEWCFTDGHAKTAITGFYNHIGALDAIDWDTVYERYWKNTEQDFDKMRRKQAEFLVKSHVPVTCIHSIVVYNEQSRNLVQEIIVRLGLNIPIHINPNNQFYY